MLLRHPVCLLLGMPCLEQAIAIVRNFRESTRSVMIGAPLWFSHGPPALRSLAEIGGGGVAEILVDSRLYGDPQEVYDIARALYLQGIRGITVSALNSRESLLAVRQAAEDSRMEMGLREVPLVIGTLLAAATEDDEWRRRVGSRLKRPGLSARLLQALVDTQYHALVLQWKDARAVVPVARALDFPLFVHAQKPAEDPDWRLQGSEKLADPQQLLVKYGFDTVLYDTTRLLQNKNTEWASDRLAKSLVDFNPERRQCLPLKDPTVKLWPIASKSRSS